MEVSIWWVVASVFAGVSVGFALCAALVMAKDQDIDKPQMAGPNLHTIV